MHYEFYDPGAHWCAACVKVESSVFDMCQHMMQPQHRQVPPLPMHTYLPLIGRSCLLQRLDANDRPWTESAAMRQQAARAPHAKSQVVAMKGLEFLLPTIGFYCSLLRI